MSDGGGTVKRSQVVYRAFSFSGLGYMGPVFPAKAGIHITVAYGNLLVVRLYGFPPARERQENEKALGRVQSIFILATPLLVTLIPSLL